MCNNVIGNTIKLQGLWDDTGERVSVAYTQSFWSKCEGCLLGWSVEKNSTHDVQIKFVGPAGSKFKLLYIVSC